MKLTGFVGAFLLGATSCTAMPGGNGVLLPLLDPPPPGQEEVYLTAALGGVLVIDRGCVKVASASGDIRTVLWHQGTELGRDTTGHFLRNNKTGAEYRFGAPMAFGGGEMPPEWAARDYPEVAKRCGPPYTSGWLPE